LPKWRGAAPIQRSIINRDKETGISLMKIEEGLDVGPYMKQIKVKIDDQTTTKLLNDKLSKIAAENILDCIKLVETNKALFIKQDSTKATYASKIDKIESKINWKDNADNILAKINGLNPYPGAWFEIEGERYKIWKAQIVNSSGAPGEILDNKSIIACGKKSIKIVEIQKEGKSKLIIEDFLKGTRIFQRKSIF
jgi:methionyl-tRNA formyltransferase